MLHFLVVINVLALAAMTDAPRQNRMQVLLPLEILIMTLAGFIPCRKHKLLTVFAESMHCLVLTYKRRQHGQSLIMAHLMTATLEAPPERFRKRVEHLGKPLWTLLSHFHLFRQWVKTSLIPAIQCSTFRRSTVSLGFLYCFFLGFVVGSVAVAEVLQQASLSERVKRGPAARAPTWGPTRSERSRRLVLEVLHDLRRNQQLEVCHGWRWHQQGAVSTDLVGPCSPLPSALRRPTSSLRVQSAAK